MKVAARKLELQKMADCASLEEMSYMLFYAAGKRGVKNPLDKSKLIEIIFAELLGHDLFVNASGGKNNLDTYGADAKDKNGIKVEYKSKTLTEPQYNAWVNKKYKTTASMVYNGAFSDENIYKYKSIRHILCLHYQGTPVAAIEVNENFILSTLEYNLEERKKKLQLPGAKPKTTNASTVYIKFSANTPTEGKIIYDSNVRLPGVSQFYK